MKILQKNLPLILSGLTLIFLILILVKVQKKKEKYDMKHMCAQTGEYCVNRSGCCRGLDCDMEINPNSCQPPVSQCNENARAKCYKLCDVDGKKGCECETQIYNCLTSANCPAPTPTCKPKTSMILKDYSKAGCENIVGLMDYPNTETCNKWKQTWLASGKSAGARCKGDVPGGDFYCKHALQGNNGQPSCCDLVTNNF